MGWVFSSTLWSLARGEDFDADPDFEQLVNFILSDQIATTNTVLGIGYSCIVLNNLCMAKSGLLGISY